jgi:hypothetical protein
MIPSVKYKMSVNLTLTSQQFQSLVSNHPDALVELGLLPTVMGKDKDKATPMPVPVATPTPVPAVQDYTEFIDLMVDIFDGPPEDLQRLREHITSALKGKKVEKKWDLEFENGAQGTPVGGYVAEPEFTLEPLASPMPAPALPDSPQMEPVSRKTLSQAHLDRLKAGRAAKKARNGYRLAPPSDCATIVSEIDAGTRISPTPSVSWKKGQAHHPNNPSVKNVIAVMANGGDMSEKQITVKSCLKAGRVRDILRELERQGIAVPF